MVAVRLRRLIRLHSNVVMAQVLQHSSERTMAQPSQNLEDIMVLYCTVKAHRVGRRQNRSDHPNQWQNCWKTKYMWHPRHATQTCHPSSHTSRKGYLGIQLRSNQCTISYIWKLQIIPISLNISSFQKNSSLMVWTCSEPICKGLRVCQTTNRTNGPVQVETLNPNPNLEFG